MSETNGTPDTVTEENSVTTVDQQDDNISEVENLKRTIGSLKREVKSLKKGTDTTDGELQTDPKPEKDELAKRVERMEIMSGTGYTQEQADRILELGGLEALKNPITKAGIDATFAKEAVKSSTQVFASVSSSEGKAEVTAADLASMSSKEMEKYLPKK